MATSKGIPRRGAAVSPAPPRFADMPSFKVEVLNALTVRHGELLYQRLFGLRIVECRVLGVVGQYGPVTLKQTAVEIGLDKGQASRLVARMEGAGWIERHADPHDQRSFYLALTPAGRRLHARVAAAAAERNEAWKQGLPAAEREGFVDGLDRLTAHVRSLLAAEQRRSGQAAAALPLHQRPRDAALPEKPLLLPAAALRDLQARLAALLGKAG